MFESTADARRLWLPRASWITVGALGVYAAAVSLAPDWRWMALLLAPAILVPLAWWSLAEPSRWLAGFCAATLLAPPLPVEMGSTGPHPAILFLVLGLWCGVARLSEWRIRNDGLTIALVLYPSIVLMSIAFAAVYSGPAVAAASLIRAGLFLAAILAFFYFADGPGSSTGETLGWARGLYFVGVVSALFACVDFYFQFPPPAGFGQQFVWLPIGVFRRAQGVFYDAGLLGNLCVFFLLLVVLAWLFPQTGRRIASRGSLLLGGVVFSAALIASFSRSSLLNLAAALGVMMLLYRRRVRFRRVVSLGALLLFGASALGLAVAPNFVEHYGTRLWYTFTEFVSIPNLMLSGRLENWQSILEFLADHPWHLAFGTGFKTLPHSDFIGQRLIADNMYLSGLVETGVFGLAAMLLFHAAILRASCRAARDTDPTTAFLGAWFFCFWFGTMFQMLSVDVLTYWRVLPLYFFVLALAVRRLRRQPEASPPTA